MNEYAKEIDGINEEIKVLKKRKDELKAKSKKTKGTNQTNILRRMSTKFFDQMDEIDKEREKLGFDSLSLPEKTELLTRHKQWMMIKQEIIYFNKTLEINGGIVNA